MPRGRVPPAGCRAARERAACRQPARSIKAGNHRRLLHVAAHDWFSAIEDLKQQDAQRVKRARAKARSLRYPFTNLRDAAHARGLHGNQQWKLIHQLEKDGATWRKSIWRGRKKFAQVLGDVDPRNTQRRLHRLVELDILRVKQGGGRRRFSRKDGTRGLMGLPNRYYPGAAIVPTVMTDKWIAEDDKRERERWERATAPAPAYSPPVDPARLRELHALHFGQARAGP